MSYDDWKATNPRDLDPDRDDAYEEAEDEGEDSPGEDPPDVAQAASWAKHLRAEKAERLGDDEPAWLSDNDDIEDDDGNPL
jgi:hypothetical protein